MKRILIEIVPLVLALFCGPGAAVLGQTPSGPSISGAVGITLGAPFPAGTYHSTNVVPGRLGYLFSPTNAPKPFKEFIAAISPISGVVYQISAVAICESKIEADLEYEKMRMLLIEKYGSPFSISDNSDNKRETDWRSAARGISLELDLTQSNVLILNYADTALEAKARIEEIEVRARNTDKSGL